MAHEYGLVIARIDGALMDIENREPMPAPDLCALWLDLKGAGDRLAIVLRDVGNDATGKLLDLVADDPEQVVETVSGTVYLGRRYAPTRWEGYRLCDALADDLVDVQTGEIVRAVRVEVLRESVAGCATEEATSSKWSKGGLKRKLGPVLREYVEEIPWRDREPEIKSGVPFR